MSINDGFPARGSELASSIRLFSSSKNYLKYNIDGSLKERVQFCNALARVSGRNEKTGSLFPWVTLVLGAEALEPPFYTPKIEKTSKELSRRFKESGILSQCYTIEQAADFMSSLMKSRSVQENEKLEVPDYDHWKLRLFYTTALLNYVYFFTKDHLGIPINRGSDELLSIDSEVFDKFPRLGQLWRSLDSVLQLLNEEISEKQSEESKREFDVDEDRQETIREVAISRLNSTMALVEQIKGSISGAKGKKERSIAANDLLAITELSWYHLADGFIESDAKHGGSRPYLSWPELMVSIGIQPRYEKEEKTTPTRHRPRLSDIESAVFTIRRKLKTPTKKRIDYYGGESPGDSLETERIISKNYQIYADILHHQSRIRAEKASLQSLGDEDTEDMYNELGEDINPVSPPIASAFVTTFDIELELAMHHHHKDTSFVVAVPVNYEYKTGDNVLSRALPLWLGYRVDAFNSDYSPDSNEYREKLYKDICEPTADKWFVLTELNKTDIGKLEIQSNGTRVPVKLDIGENGLDPLPVIVRLTGSPLVELPPVSDITIEEKILDEEDQKDDEAFAAYETLKEAITRATGLDSLKTKTIQNYSNTAPAKLQHALVLEEFHSIQRSAPELIQIAYRSLPRGLSGVPDKGLYFRFWTLLGVQTSDEAVLYQLIAQLVASQVELEDKDQSNSIGKNDEFSNADYTLSSNEQTAEINRRLGLTINSSGSVTEHAKDLLLWSELDIISDSVWGFSNELQHYNYHLINELNDNEPKYKLSSISRGNLCKLEKTFNSLINEGR